MDRSPIRYSLLVLAIVAVGLAGFVGYVAYPRFDLPRGTGIGLVGLAAAAGVASFFSPCSFPLLATLLIRESRPDDPGPVRVRRALSRAIWIAAGAATFVIMLGLVIAAGGAGLASSVTFDSVAGRTLRAEGQTERTVRHHNRRRAVAYGFRQRGREFHFQIVMCVNVDQSWH